jgi:hypothetical protein
MEGERLIMEVLPGLTYKRPSFEPGSSQHDYGVLIPKQLFLVVMETTIVLIIAIRFVCSAILNFIGFIDVHLLPLLKIELIFITFYVVCPASFIYV